MKTLAGLLLATLLTMTAGCARTDWIDRTLVTVDVTGYWVTPDNTLWLELKQEGAKVTGSYGWRGWYANQEREGQLEGTLSGDTFRFKEVVGASLEGEMTINGDEMSGRLQATRTNSLRSLRRVSPQRQ